MSCFCHLQESSRVNTRTRHSIPPLAKPRGVTVGTAADRRRQVRSHGSRENTTTACEIVTGLSAETAGSDGSLKPPKLIYLNFVAIQPIQVLSGRKVFLMIESVLDNDFFLTEMIV